MYKQLAPESLPLDAESQLSLWSVVVQYWLTIEDYKKVLTGTLTKDLVIRKATDDIMTPMDRIDYMMELIQSLPRDNPQIENLAQRAAALIESRFRQ